MTPNPSLQVEIETKYLQCSTCQPDSNHGMLLLVTQLLRLFFHDVIALLASFVRKLTSRALPTGALLTSSAQAVNVSCRDKVFDTRGISYGAVIVVVPCKKEN